MRSASGERDVSVKLTQILYIDIGYLVAHIENREGLCLPVTALVGRYGAVR